jgi:hypothetical protein
MEDNKKGRDVTKIQNGKITNNINSNNNQPLQLWTTLELMDDYIVVEKKGD